MPDYPIGCKRILISNDWYPTLMRPDVEVVDQPIDHIESDAVVTVDGRRRPADVLIFGTGFNTTDFLAHIPVVGEGGGHWPRRGATGHTPTSGTAVPGFPNCYLLYGPNTNLGHNSILFMVERQINLILQAIAVQVRSAGAGGGSTPGRGERGRLPPGRRTHPTPDVDHRLGGRLHQLVQDGVGPGDQQLAVLDGPLLVRHRAPAAGRPRDHRPRPTPDPTHLSGSDPVRST